VNGEGGCTDGENFGEDGTEADKSDEVVFAEHCFYGEVARNCARVVEGQSAWGSVAAGEDVIWFYDADVDFETAPEELDGYGDCGEEEGDFLRDDRGIWKEQ